MRFDILFEILQCLTEISTKFNEKGAFTAKVEWSILSRYGNDPSLTLDPFERLLALRSAFGFPCFALSICCDSNLSSLSFNSLTIEGRVVHSLSRSASAALSQCTRTSREGEGERLVEIDWLDVTVQWLLVKFNVPASLGFIKTVISRSNFNEFWFFKKEFLCWSMLERMHARNAKKSRDF